MYIYTYIEWQRNERVATIDYFPLTTGQFAVMLPARVACVELGLSSWQIPAHEKLVDELMATQLWDGLHQVVYLRVRAWCS